MEKVYIILVNYNGWKDTIECLESVLKNQYENYQIIVIDNDSPNDSMKYIINWAEGKQDVIYDENSKLKHLSQPFEPKPLDYVFYTKEEVLNGLDKEREALYKNPLIFIQAGENGGFATGNNIGIKYALAKDDFQYIWLLNNDTVINNDTLSLLIKNIDKNNIIGIYGNTLKYYNFSSVIQTYGGYLNQYFATSSYITTEQEFEKINFISGASMLITKDCILNIGLLPEEYFLYYEETDYCFRAKKFGFNLKVIPESITYHKEGASTSLSSKNIKMDLLFHSNRLIFAKKYLNNILMVKFGICLAAIKRFIKFELIQGLNLLKLVIRKK